MDSVLNWGIVGTGAIANDFAEALRTSKRCRIVNVVGSDRARTAEFAARWALPRASSSLEELLADPAVDAAYVATVHPRHEAQTLACLAAKKPVLCEKPMSVSVASVERMLAAARSHGVFLMEGYMYRCHPLLRVLLDRLNTGELGRLCHVRSTFGFRVRRDPGSRLFDVSRGGGSILDVGGYPVSLVRLLAGVPEGKPFAEPIQLQASGKVGPTGVDELANALLKFASGLTAELVSALRFPVGTATVIFAENGWIELPNPFLPRGQRHGLESEFTVHVEGRDPELVRVQSGLGTYAIEAELVADALPAPEAPWPAMSWADTLGNMRVMEAWRAQLA